MKLATLESGCSASASSGPWAGQLGVTVWTLAGGQLPGKVMWAFPAFAELDLTPP